MEDVKERRDEGDDESLRREQKSSVKSHVESERWSKKLTGTRKE